MAKPTRPALVTVLSVFNILIGIVTIVCGGGCGAMMAWAFSTITSMPGPPGQPNPVKEMFALVEKHFPYYQQIMVASFILAGVWGLLLILCGIGTLMLKQWGRILTILTGLAIMLHALSIGGYYVAVVIPNQAKLMNEWIEYLKKIEEDARKKQQAQTKGAPPAPPPPAFATPPTNDPSNHVLYLGMLLACIAYGAGMVIVMLLPGTRAAFAAAGMPQEEDTSDRDRLERRRRLLDDDDFDRPRRY